MFDIDPLKLDNSKGKTTVKVLFGAIVAWTCSIPLPLSSSSCKGCLIFNTTSKKLP